MSEPIGRSSLASSADRRGACRAISLPSVFVDRLGRLIGCASIGLVHAISLPDVSHQIQRQNVVLN
jgi:hypothetical protein